MRRTDLPVRLLRGSACSGVRRRFELSRPSRSDLLDLLGLLDLLRNATRNPPWSNDLHQYLHHEAMPRVQVVHPSRMRVDSSRSVGRLSRSSSPRQARIIARLTHSGPSSPTQSPGYIDITDSSRRCWSLYTQPSYRDQIGVYRDQIQGQKTGPNSGPRPVLGGSPTRTGCPDLAH